MSKKFEIIGNSLIVTDTISDVIEIDEPSKDVYFDNNQLNSGYILITQKDGSRSIDSAISNKVLLTDAVDSSLVSFTDATFRSFARKNLSSGVDFIVDETNMVATFLKNGSSEAQNVDGSVTPVEFSYTPPAGFNFLCTNLHFYMEGSTAFDSNTFGNLAELTNGWTMNINGVDALLVKSNRDFATFMFDMKGEDIFGKTTRTTVGRFSFSKFTDGADGITIKDGQSFKTIVKDNLSTLTYLEVKVMGVLKPI